MNNLGIPFTYCSGLVGFSFKLAERFKTTFLFTCRNVALSLFIFCYLNSSTDVALDISVAILFTVSYISLLSLSLRLVFFSG